MDDVGGALEQVARLGSRQWGEHSDLVQRFAMVAQEEEHDIERQQHGDRVRHRSFHHRGPELGSPARHAAKDRRKVHARRHEAHQPACYFVRLDSALKVAGSNLFLEGCEAGGQCTEELVREECERKKNEQGQETERNTRRQVRMLQPRLEAAMQRHRQHRCRQSPHQRGKKRHGQQVADVEADERGDEQRRRPEKVVAMSDDRLGNGWGEIRRCHGPATRLPPERFQLAW